MVVASTGVFVTRPTNALFHFHFNKCQLNESIVIYSDYEQFKSSNHSKKIACYQMPFPFDDNFYADYDQMYDICDYVIVLCSELHGRTVQFIQRNDRPKSVYFVCGALNVDMQHAQVHSWHDWFITTKHFYCYVRPETLNELNPYTPKNKMFDALLGTRKPHRDTAYNYVKDNNLEDQAVMTYFKNPDLVQKFSDTDTEEWIWPKDYSAPKDKDINWTVTIVDYHGYRMSLSQIVPIDIYNQTAYSVVAETNAENDWCFFTEKVVKPILGRRLFVLLGNRYYLQRLRELGFKTFNDVIDETYDTLGGSNQRATEAMKQMHWLCQQPQEEILAKIKPICEHNYNHMMSTDWYDVYFKSEFVKYFNQ